MSDEFYVGYSPKAPVHLAKTIAAIAGGLLLAGCVLGMLLILDQARFADSKFEFGVYREYSGTIEAAPYPILRTSNASYLLVAPGKHGLSAAGLAGKNVSLKGSLIERGRDRMLEVPPESLRESSATPAPPEQEVDLGPVRLRGEIVDSKCFLGVMNPGNGKVHRDCAVRCISGGAPPAFVVRDVAGETKVLLLVGPDGRALNREVLDFIAEPLQISGELVRSGPTLTLKADPAKFHHECGINSPAWCIR